MKPLTPITASLFALVLAACGNAQDAQPASVDTAEMPMDMADHDGMDHSDHNMSDGMGHATGIIRSVGTQGDFVTIEHGPIEGVGMSAMTMGFDIMGDVDLADFKDGDEVAFMVKQGRDGSYRITAICNTVAQGADCLDRIMDH